MDVETIGAAATSGLAASAISGPEGHGGEHHAVCADCGTPTLGRFCHNCGNPAHVHRTLLHLGEELLHGVMHFDSRAWRTLPMLLARPGTLTRGWIEGRRARYVSPLAIFLFTMFVMFMALSYAPTSKPGEAADARLTAAADLALKRTAVADLETALASASPEDRPEVERELAGARVEVERLAKEARDLSAGHAFAAKDWKIRVAEEARSGKLAIDLGDKALNEKIRHKLENPELALYKLQQTFYKFSFLLVPISIPFVALLFVGRRGVTLYDHGVFVLYSLTFVSLLIMALAVATRVGGPVGNAMVQALPWVIPAHMFFQIKGTYGLKPWPALWRTGVLLVFCVLAMIAFVLAILWLNLA